MPNAAFSFELVISASHVQRVVAHTKIRARRAPKANFSFEYVILYFWAATPGLVLTSKSARDVIGPFLFRGGNLYLAAARNCITELGV